VWKEACIRVAWWSYSLRHIGHTHNHIGHTHAIMDFWNLWKRKYCYRFTLLLFTQQYKTTRITVISSHCLAASPAKGVWGQQSHAEKRINHRNLKWTFEDSLPCYCYATKRNSRTMRLQVSQRESAGDGVEMSELHSPVVTRGFWGLSPPNKAPSPLLD